MAVVTGHCILAENSEVQSLPTRFFAFVSRQGTRVGRRPLPARPVLSGSRLADAYHLALGARGIFGVQGRYFHLVVMVFHRAAIAAQGWMTTKSSSRYPVENAYRLSFLTSIGHTAATLRHPVLPTQPEIFCCYISGNIRPFALSQKCCAAKIDHGI